MQCTCSECFKNCVCAHGVLFTSLFNEKLWVLEEYIAETVGLWKKCRSLKGTASTKSKLLIAEYGAYGAAKNIKLKIKFIKVQEGPKVPLDLNGSKSKGFVIPVQFPDADLTSTVAPPQQTRKWYPPCLQFIDAAVVIITLCSQQPRRPCRLLTMMRISPKRYCNCCVRVDDMLTSCLQQRVTLSQKGKGKEGARPRPGKPLAMYNRPASPSRPARVARRWLDCRGTTLIASRFIAGRQGLRLAKRVEAGFTGQQLSGILISRDISPFSPLSACEGSL